MKCSMLIHPEELSKEWIDRLADAGIDTMGIHPHGGEEAIDSLKGLLARVKTSEFRALIDYAHTRGVSVEYEIHAAGYLLPRELYDDHPEYFRTDEKGNKTNEGNFCISNADALDLVSKRAADLALSLYGSGHSFYFWMDDGHCKECHCPKCKSFSPSEQQMIALNAMLKEIKKHIPDASMAYLAYMDTVVPPYKVRMEDGIFLEYAPFEKYTAKGENSAELISREKEMIASLLKCFENAPKKVLEYWYDNSLFSGWKKPPARFVLNREAMLKDIKEYRALGFDCVSTFACFLGKDYEELYGSVDITPFAKCIDNSL